MSQKIRILIAEREALYRRGIEASLRTVDAFEVVATVENVEDAYRMADEMSPDVALVGTTLVDAPGLALSREMRRRHPAVAVIVVAAVESDDELFGAIRAGAAAYCGRDISEETLFSLIERAAGGEYVINEQLLQKPYVAARVLDQFRSNTVGEPSLGAEFMPLTDRELEILKKVSDGMTNAEIGYALGISAQTVKNHVTSILRKLAVNDRTQAVVTALRRGWLTISDEPVNVSPGAGVTQTPTSRLGSERN
jgi:DNA-binding NarL/FixJ family response regulator